MRAYIVVAAVAACTAITSCRIGTEPTPVAIAVTSCTGASATPIWLAVKDGDGPWRRIERHGESYEFTIRSGRAGIATVSASTGTTLDVTYATAAELAAILPGCADLPVAAGVAPRSFTGSVAGRDPSDQVWIHLGSRFNVTATNTFVVGDDDRGPVDLIAVRLSPSTPVLNRYATSVIIRRNLELTSGATIPLLDFAGSEAIVPILRPIVIDAEGESVLYSSTILRAPARSIRLAELRVASGGPGTRFHAGAPVSGLLALLSEAHLVPGEWQETGVQLNGAEAATTHERRLVLRGVNQTSADLSIGPRIVMDLFTLNGAQGTVRVEAEYRIQREYDGHWALSSSQEGRVVRVRMSRGYAGSASKLNLIVPDLIGTDGFSPSWLLRTREITSWRFDVSSQDLVSEVRGTGRSSYRSASRFAAASFVP